MRKLFIVLALLVMSSFTSRTYTPVLFSNQQQEAVQLIIYYDFYDGNGWTFYDAMNIPGAYARTYRFDGNNLWRYRYCTNRDQNLKPVIGEVINLY